VRLAVFVCGIALSLPAQAQIASTFAYTTPADENRIRAVFEVSAVYTVGFTFFLATNRLLPKYEVGYSWPVFREKLLGAGFELDINGLNTNFVGHPLGGSMYYTMARSNRLNVAESTAFAIGGSLLWELFGEVREYISINDMIVTPLAGLAIAEPFFQLGAFFDRSSPRLHNRLLGAAFAPVKSLNDWLDGRSLARAAEQDASGFPANEYHRFDLLLGAAAVTQNEATGYPNANRTFESRVSLASYLIRLPGYDRAGEHSLFFGEANVTSIDLAAAFNGAGLVDFEMHTLVGIAGFYSRSARTDVGSGVRGRGTLLSVTMGYQYVLHDYDRDRPWPRDRFSSVQPLGLLLEHRVDWGKLVWLNHVEAGLDFGGLRPYALTVYRSLGDAAMLPVLVENNAYCFVRGGHLLASMRLTLAGFELSAKLRYERFAEVDVPVAVQDSRVMMEGRATLALGHSPARLSLVVQRRVRKGSMGAAHVERSETSMGLELGANY
jgi:hypothetical protein